jgi:hypothetical protein
MELLLACYIAVKAYTLALLLVSIPVCLHASYTAVTNTPAAGTQTLGRRFASIRHLAIRPITQELYIYRRYMLLLLR